MTTPQQPSESPAELLDELASPQWLARPAAAGPGGAGSAGTRYGGSPVNLPVLQHVARCDNDVAAFIDRARAAGAEPESAPADRAGIYRAAAAAAEELGGDWPRHLEAMQWRATVESELLLGETAAIRREPCPECRTAGLVWVRALRLVSCVNRHCAARSADGRHRTWTIAQLAVVRSRARRLRAAS